MHDAIWLKAYSHHGLISRSSLRLPFLHVGRETGPTEGSKGNVVLIEGVHNRPRHGERGGSNRRDGCSEELRAVRLDEKDRGVLVALPDNRCRLSIGACMGSSALSSQIRKAPAGSIIRVHGILGRQGVDREDERLRSHPERMIVGDGSRGQRALDKSLRNRDVKRFRGRRS